MNKFFVKNKLEVVFIAILFLIVLFFSTYKLTESPPIWFDEANYIQVAMNLAEFGRQGIQTAPVEIDHPDYLTVGYPLIYPLSISLKYFGVGLLPARSVMVIFIVGLVMLSYILIKRMFRFNFAVASSLLLVTFPPLYGNGKNIMGEVPGMFWLFLFLFFIYKLEKTNFKNLTYCLLAGLTAGLCLATKPIFLIILTPVILISIFLKRKQINFQWQPVLVFIFSLLLPLLIWINFYLQGSGSLAGIFINPHGIGNYYQTISGNFLRFFTELTPIYFFSLFIIWIFSVLIRLKNKINITVTELIAFCFSVLLFIAYLTTVGFYRYFFPAHILALIFFPNSLYIFLHYLNNKSLKLRIDRIIILFISVPVLLVMVNFYQLLFDSWVSDHYNSKKTAELSNYFNNYPQDKSIFLYNAPAIAMFLPHRNYYQYIEFTPSLLIGERQLKQIELKVPDEIIIPEKNLTKINKESDLFKLYEIKDNIREYSILRIK